jgi:hypothetical protein
MNLFDIMGLVAIGVGLGASYGVTKEEGVSWVALAIACLMGAAAFLILRRITLEVSQRALIFMYVGTPLLVLLTTVLSVWWVRHVLL